MCCNEERGYHHRHHSNCECGEKHGQHCHHDCGDECGCGDSGFRRRYQTKSEQISELEEYLAELKAEAQAVEERLADMRK
jgi:hypothetical protein